MLMAPPMVLRRQRALRAVQDLDALDIEQILVRADRARVIDAVDINADARIEVEGEVVLTNTADGAESTEFEPENGEPASRLTFRRQR